MQSRFVPVLALILAGAGCAASEEAPDTEQESEAELDYEVGAAGDLVGTVVLPSGERLRVGSSASETVRTTRVVGEDGTVHLDWDMTLEDDEIIGEMGGQSFGRFEDYETDQDLALWRSIADSPTGQALADVSSAAGAELAAASHPPQALAALQALAAAAGYLEEMASPPDPTLDDNASPPPGCACDAECGARGDCCTGPGACETYQCAPGDPSCDHLCADDQFQCEDGTCLAASVECDGALDCALGEDEDWCGASARVSAPEVGLETTDCDRGDRAGNQLLAAKCGMKYYGMVALNYPRGGGLCEHHVGAHNGPTKVMDDPNGFDDVIAVCASRYSAKAYSERGRLLAKASRWRFYANAWAHIVTSQTPCIRMKFWSTYRRHRWGRQCSESCGYNGPH